MIEVLISPEYVNVARQEAEQIGRLNNSIRKGEGNIYGCLGELLVADFIDGKIVHTYDYDLVKNEVTFDVKTKACTSTPKMDYECSVAAFNTNQNCDFYTFVRILEDCSVGWILGSYPKVKYFEDARFCRAGEVDVMSHFGWKFKADCYNLPIHRLLPFKKMLCNKD